MPSFNACKVDVACIGNHDLDFGINAMDKCLKQSMSTEESMTSQPGDGNCQWIMTNLVQDDRPADGPMSVGCCSRTAVMEVGSLKIGFIGIAEKEWVDMFKNLEVEILYQNYKRCAIQYAKKLREEDGCNYIIALTHMRVRHDEKFAREIPGVDLVLGGHDHEYHCKEVAHKLKDQSHGP